MASSDGAKSYKRKREDTKDQAAASRTKQRKTAASAEPYAHGLERGPAKSLGDKAQHKTESSLSLKSREDSTGEPTANYGDSHANGHAPKRDEKSRQRSSKRRRASKVVGDNGHGTQRYNTQVNGHSNAQEQARHGGKLSGLVNGNGQTNPRRDSPLMLDSKSFPEGSQKTSRRHRRYQNQKARSASESQGARQVWHVTKRVGGRLNEIAPIFASDQQWVILLDPTSLIKVSS